VDHNPWSVTTIIMDSIMDIIVDRFGDYLKSLPPTVQNIVGAVALASVALMVAYALVTPDTICDGCP